VRQKGKGTSKTNYTGNKGRDSPKSYSALEAMHMKSVSNTPNKITIQKLSNSRSLKETN